MALNEYTNLNSKNTRLSEQLDELNILLNKNIEHDELIANKALQAEIELTNLKLKNAKEVFEADIKSIELLHKREKDNILADDKLNQKTKEKYLKWIEAKENSDKKNKEKERQKQQQQMMKDWEEQAKAANKVGFGFRKAIKGAALEAFNGDENALKDVQKNLLKQQLGESAKKVASTTWNTVTSGINELVNSIAGMRSSIDTNLQGANMTTKNGSYWDQLSSDLASTVGASALVKQSDLANNVKQMINSGISYNVEQRAFLATISDKIATTFNNSDATMLRLIRLQQQDSTAARLGMESTMTAFLNNMYENSEYLRGVADDVRSQISEASALMSAQESIGFEYQVQKWLGSLYSVGFSNTSGLASAIGKLASGDISGLTSGGASNLLVMAANNAGLSISEALVNGLDESNTNKLMEAVVSYLGNIYASTEGNRLLQQQYASIFGITASDLKAAANLSNSLSTISGSSLNNNAALGRLSDMAGTMYSRMSLGERLSNTLDNFKYGIASSIANSKGLYTTYAIANLLKETTGGIDIPLGLLGSINVADTMLATALGGGILGGIGNVINGGIGNNAASMLAALQLMSPNAVSRGTGINTLSSGGSNVSESGVIGNYSSADIQSSSVSSSLNNSTQTVSAIDTTEEVTSKTIDNDIIKIYNILESVITGSKTLNVKVDGYGLTGNPWN